MVDLIEAIGTPATLELLAEECTELAQAALKTARVLRGENPTPTTLDEAVNHLAEEMADVEIMMSAVQRIDADSMIDPPWKVGPIPELINSWKGYKQARLECRLEKQKGRMKNDQA